MNKTKFLGQPRLFCAPTHDPHINVVFFVSHHVPPQIIIRKIILQCWTTNIKSTKNFQTNQDNFFFLSFFSFFISIKLSWILSFTIFFFFSFWLLPPFFFLLLNSLIYLQLSCRRLIKCWKRIIIIIKKGVLLPKHVQF